jgi:hypothetical protein
MRTRGSLAIATAVTGSALALTLAAPMAHADPVVDDISNIIKNDRTKYAPGCPSPMTYNSLLENIAQRENIARKPADTSNYKGQVAQFIGNGDRRAAALTNAYEKGAGATLSNCDFTEFGASFLADNGAVGAQVALAFGKPAAAPKPPDKKASDPVPEKKAPDPVPEKKAPDPVPQATPVTNAITLSFGAVNPGSIVPPSPASITATVRNSSDLPGHCTYDATGLADTHRDFDVAAHGSKDLTFTGIRTGTSYHAKVSCSDASNKQTQPIGTADSDVRF